jgi:outer membrane protein
LRRFLCILGLVCLGAAPAGAADIEYWEAWTAGGNALRGASTLSQWRGNFGVGFGVAPEYPGAKNYEAVGLPLVDVEWRDTVFFSTQRGLGAHLWTGRQLRAGVRLTYDRGRDSSTNLSLRARPDIKSSYEAGAFIEYYRKAWRFTADVRKGITDGHKGIVISAGLAFGGRISERASVILGGNIHFADSNYMGAYFDAATVAESGVRDVGVIMHVIYSLTDRVYITIDPRISLLQGDAALSQLTDDDVQYFLGSLIGYRF